MKFIALIVSLIILSTAPISFNANNVNVFVGHVNDHGSIIVVYDGNNEVLKQYFLSFHVSVYEYKNYYLLNGSPIAISNALNLKNGTAYLPYYIAKDVKALFSGKAVLPNIEYSVDPYFVNYIIDAYNVISLLKNGINGSGYSAVIVVPYGDPNLLKNFQSFNKLNDIENGSLTIKYFISKPDATVQNWTTETDLDVEMLHAFAPGAKIIVAVAPNDNSTSLEMVLLRVINERLGNVISLSWGGPELEIYDSFFHYIFKRAAMAGITVIAASGDSPGVEYPASDPYVLSVGGTTLSINGTKYVQESIWKSSGGGFSTIFPRPPWQVGPGHFNSTGRGVPDISLDGNPLTGVYIYSNGEIAVGGTSMAAPMFAGMVLDLEQKENTTFGFFTPQLYYMNNLSSSEYFNHVYLKNSFCYGWFPQIGLGSPKILNWTFPRKTFSTGVNLGNFTNVSELSFFVRGNAFMPFHPNESDLFYVQLQSENKSISIGFSQTDRKFFYYFNSYFSLNYSVSNNQLYHIIIYLTKNKTYLLIDGSNFSMPMLGNKFSIYVFAESTGKFSFYTDLGPVEFRDFLIIKSDGKKIMPDYIASLKSQGPESYGAMELPFLKNDFLIGAINVPGEEVLWPRTFSYIEFGGINGNFIFNIPDLVGTGTFNDPYIISGLEINSSNFGFYYNGNNYFVLNHCIINAPYGIIVLDSNLKIIDTKINSTIGIEGYFATISIINSTFRGIVGINAPFSNLYLLKNTYFVLFPQFFIYQIIEGNLILYMLLVISLLIAYLMNRKMSKKN